MRHTVPIAADTVPGQDRVQDGERGLAGRLVLGVTGVRAQSASPRKSLPGGRGLG